MIRKLGSLDRGMSRLGTSFARPVHLEHPGEARQKDGTMLKKMMLLAGMALAVIAFAAPASASALEWTDDNAPFEGTIEDTLSGKISFGNPAVGATKFGCIAHAGVTFEGGTGADEGTGWLDSFVPTTSTCVGEGSFAGCSLSEHETTIPRDANGKSLAKIHIVETNKVTLTTPAGNPIVIHNVYNAGCAIEKSTLTVSHLTLTGTNSDLTDVSVSGGALSHTWIRNVGEITQEVAVFGTMGTATDTITMS